MEIYYVWNELVDVGYRVGRTVVLLWWLAVPSHYLVTVSAAQAR